MKTIFTIFLCLLGVTVIFAQEQPAAKISEKDFFLSEMDSTATYFTYTSEDQIASATTQKRDASGTWYNVAKADYTYNNADQITEVAISDWSVVTGSWQNKERRQFSYTAGGELEVNLYQLWDGAWVDFNRATYYFNLPGELADSMILQHWNSTSTAWEPEGRWVYTWNSSDLLERQIYSTMYNATEWQVLSRDTMTYTAFGEIAQSVHAIYLAPQWISSSRMTYTYNADELLTQTDIQNYNTQAGTWQGIQRITYTYNPDNSLHQEILSSFDEALGSYVPFSRDTYFYGAYFLGLDEEAFATVEVFPNPTQADVQIRFEQATTAELILTDLQGKTLSATAVSGLTATISLESLPAGTYLLNIRSGNQNGVRRIVKL